MGVIRSDDSGIWLLTPWGSRRKYIVTRGVKRPQGVSIDEIEETGLRDRLFSCNKEKNKGIDKCQRRTGTVILYIVYVLVQKVRTTTISKS